LTEDRINARSRPSSGPPPAGQEEMPASCRAAACRGLPRPHPSKRLLSPATALPRAVMPTPGPAPPCSSGHFRPGTWVTPTAHFSACRAPPSQLSLQALSASLPPPGCRLRAAPGKALRAPSVAGTDRGPICVSKRMRPLLTQPTTASHLHLMQIRKILTNSNIDKRFL
jgi:hypothetical protein